MRVVSVGSELPGVVAIGQRATGIVAVGQQATGVVVLGQEATGVIAIGQLALGVIAIGQVARGVIAIGQLSLGLVAVGMLAGGVLWCPALGVGGTTGSVAAYGFYGRLSRRRLAAWLGRRRGPWDSPPRWPARRRFWAAAGLLALVALWWFAAARPLLDVLA
jgi:hypothetical protein